MERMTRRKGKTAYVAADAINSGSEGYEGKAIEMLAAYEDIHEKILQEQEALAEELEKLRKQDKAKSARFRELMGKKLVNASLLSVMQARGLE